MEIQSKIEELARKHAEGMDEEIIKQFSELVLYLIENKLVELVVTEKKIETEGDFVKLVQSVKVRFTGEEELLRLRQENRELREEMKNMCYFEVDQDVVDEWNNGE